MIFFITLFRYFTIVLFFTLHFFSFSQGMQTRERAHCARSVFPFIKKKKKNTHGRMPYSVKIPISNYSRLPHPVSWLATVGSRLAVTAHGARTADLQYTACVKDPIRLFSHTEVYGTGLCMAKVTNRVE